MNEREKLLHAVQLYGFAEIDSGLYLDSHPKDAAALAYHRENACRHREAVEVYEKRFGPLTAHAVGEQWGWVSDPWPWEGEDN